MINMKDIYWENSKEYDNISINYKKSVCERAVTL